MVDIFLKYVFDFEKAATEPAESTAFLAPVYKAKKHIFMASNN